MINLALQRWRQQETSLGIWCNLSNIHLAEIVARSGVGWICFDLQHGLMDYRDLTRLLPAVCGLPVTPLVRVAANEADQIGKALDAGAHGIIVPIVNSAADARRAVESCRYPPEGIRSCGPMRDVMLEGFSYLETANSQVACIAMIETEEGLANVDAIAAVDGLDALFVGPMDLCYGLGLVPGSFGDERFTAALRKIIDACSRYKRAAGTFGYTPELAAQALQDGFHFVSIGTDISFFRAGLSQSLATVDSTRSRSGPKSSAGY